jgi:hypothetical protein
MCIMCSYLCGSMWILQCVSIISFIICVQACSCLQVSCTWHISQFQTEQEYSFMCIACKSTVDYMWWLSYLDIDILWHMLMHPWQSQTCKLSFCSMGWSSVILWPWVHISMASQMHQYSPPHQCVIQWHSMMEYYLMNLLHCNVIFDHFSSPQYRCTQVQILDLHRPCTTPGVPKCN